MKRALLVVMLAACGGGPVDNTGPGDWNDAVNAMIAAVCDDLEPCTGADPGQCADDIHADMAQAKEELDDAGETACIECMNVKAEQAHNQSFTCDPADIDMQAIVDACGANDESCAGFP